MEELMRFQQLRPLQTISEEQASALGIALYPKNKLTPFAKSLVDSKERESYVALIGRYEEASGGKNIISATSQLHPFIKALYDWFSFKARPVKKNDLDKFLQTLKTGPNFVIDDEWNSIADNLLVAIERNRINVNYCVNFQELIRICQLIMLCLEFKGEVPGLAKNVTMDLINEILSRSVILPRAALRGRCSTDCSQGHNMDILRQPPPKYPPSRDGKCQCKCDPSCQPPDNHCVCIRTYIADLFIVKQDLARYEAGELADIENILAGELKLRHHRTLMHSEDSSQTETETVTSEERDHQVTEKNTLQSEVKNTIDTKLNVDAGVTATLKYGEAITVTPHANVTYNNAKSESENIARSYAKEIVDRSVTKVQETARKVIISKVINEVEEKNRHSIDNTQAGADHRAGLYYWVNKVSHAQVFNHGKHMMFDLIIPEPAATWKVLYTLKQKNDNALQMPQNPNVTPGEINAANYGNKLSQYGISSPDDIQPPDETIALQIPFSTFVTEPENGATTGFSSTEFKSADIPKGYKADRMDYEIRANTGHPESTGDRDQVAVSVHCGNYELMNRVLNEWQSANQGISLPLPIPNWTANGSHAMNGEAGTITVALAGFSTLAFSLSGSLSITCKLTDEGRTKWQDQIYNLIMTDYNRKLDAYNNAQGGSDDLVQIKGRNPFLNREIERNEFKRHVVAILMCNYFNGMGSMMESVAPCGYPEINFSKLERDAPIIQFFEQVFEWEYMNYLFYHSMWARKCKWPELISEDSGDPLFDKFLTAGASRVQVPVRPGMEDIFHWFLKTGQLWGASGKPPMPGDADYVSMIQELKESLQGDYDDRPGLIAATQGTDTLTLINSNYYWDLVNDVPAQPNIDNDADREILVNYKVYRIVKVEQTNPPADKTSWTITIERPYEGPTAANLKHAVGALFVGAPWEVVVPTELVYLRNIKDTLPAYPLS
jgi:hypothetical protein